MHGIRHRCARSNRNVSVASLPHRRGLIKARFVWIIEQIRCHFAAQFEVSVARLSIYVNDLQTFDLVMVIASGHWLGRAKVNVVRSVSDMLSPTRTA